MNKFFSRWIIVLLPSLGWVQAKRPTMEEIRLFWEEINKEKEDKASITKITQMLQKKASLLDTHPPEALGLPKGSTPIHIAALRGKPTTFSITLAVNRCAIQLALIKGQRPPAPLLHQKNKRGLTPLMEALNGRRKRKSWLFLDDYTLIVSVILHSSTPELITYKAPDKKRGDGWDNQNVVDFVKKERLKTMEKEINKYLPLKKELTPLMLAILAGNFKDFQRHLNESTVEEINQFKSGKTPLDIAISEYNKAMIEALL